MIKIPKELNKVLRNHTIWADSRFNFPKAEERLSRYWNYNKDTIQSYAQGKLKGIKTEYLSHLELLSDEAFDVFVGDLSIPDTTSKFKSELRLSTGYNFLTPTLSPTVINLFSPEAFKLKKARKMGNKCTDDHIFGVTPVGLDMFLNYMNSDWDIEYMIQKWLPEHLYYWLTAKVLKTEHQGDDSIGRCTHTLTEKKELKHYIDAGIPHLICVKI